MSKRLGGKVVSAGGERAICIRFTAQGEVIGEEGKK